MRFMTEQVTIIGGGLAGSEAAWQLAQRGIPVLIKEMRHGKNLTSVHKTDHLAELVCSNSFRGTDETKNAVALLHRELRQLNSLIMKAADENRVPAGGALGISREEFAEYITDAIETHPLITLERGEVTEIPKKGHVIIATGPRTSNKLADAILELTGEERLSFFDAVAPIIAVDSIDMSIAWKQSRYDKGDGSDYINCPMTEEQYNVFVRAIVEAEQAIDHNSEDAQVPFFEGCLPIEVMAERGPETLRFGPMKPKGLTNKHKPDEKPYGVVQLRQDNKLGTLFNMVGFQTKMKWGEQKRLFRTIPGLESAEIERFGVIHKNTFINSPALLDKALRLKSHPHIRFAGQVSGVEGYVESTAMGALCGILTASEIQKSGIIAPPPTTAMGALVTHITGGADAKTFQPMNVNYSLVPPLDEKHKKSDRKPLYGERARNDFSAWSEKI